MTDAPRSAAAPKEWNADAYHRLSQPQFAWGRQVLERLPLRGGESVLDAGCGSGRLTRELADRLKHGLVVGCDLSENMARAAATTLGGNGRTVVCADLSFLPFRDGTFDVVFSTATFHWILDHDRLFASLRRVLRKGGRLEAQCGGGQNLANIHARADALAQEQRFRRFFTRWREPWLFVKTAEAEACLHRAGFREVRCWLQEAPTPFTDAGLYRAFLESVVMRPYLAHLTDPGARNEFLDGLVGQAADDDPPFTLDYWRLNISATA